MKKFRPFFALALTISLASAATPFGGEDLLGTSIANWHHADISKRGALAALFSDKAAEAICWHADYVDSYGYNPLWWAQGLPSLTRTKAALSAKGELNKVHFDDLYTTRLNGGLGVRRELGTLRNGTERLAPGVVNPPLTQPINRTPRNAVELQMRRYLSGTVDGLIYAADTNDVAMAHHILGVSLHALQDFYSHSNWIDEPSRRKQTYFDMATTSWTPMGSLTLFTGTYETPTQAGVQSHGKYAFACTIMNQPGMKTVLGAACSAFSPIANDDVCRQYKECRQGTSLQGAQLSGVQIPNNVLYLAPVGINLDSTWLAEVGAKERGIVAPGFTAQDAFRTAERSAIRATEQWLRRTGEAMKALGKGAFWQQVMTANTIGSYNNPSAAALAQWENFGKLGYQFVSAGTYPPKATDPVEEHFLRVKIKTSTETYSGTDSNIYAVVNGQSFLLDNMPAHGESVAKHVLAYNDFEAGDDNVYLVGPLKSIPTSLTLQNRSATAGDVVLAAAEAFVNTIVEGLTRVVNGVIGFFKTLAGSDPDFVAQNKKVWRYAELPQTVGQSTSLPITLNGGDEGNYNLNVTIRKTADLPGPRGGDADYVVQVNSLSCIKESKWDRGSSADEPFIAVLVNPLTGTQHKRLFGPFNDVDSGETVNINTTFPAVRIPKGSGSIVLPALLMESDDESGSERNEILDKFAGELDKQAATKKAGFLDTLGAAVAADWKVDEVDVWAFSKGDTVRSGRVGRFVNVGWIEGKAARTFNLGALPNTNIRAQDLENMNGINAVTTASAPSRPLLLVLVLGAASLAGAVFVRGHHRRSQYNPSSGRE
jgi:hypothetical protein